MKFNHAFLFYSVKAGSIMMEDSTATTDLLLPDLFIRQAKTTPDKVAVVSERGTVSYAIV